MKKTNIICLLAFSALILNFNITNPISAENLVLAKVGDMEFSDLQLAWGYAASGSLGTKEIDLQTDFTVNESFCFPSNYSGVTLDFNGNTIFVEGNDGQVNLYNCAETTLIDSSVEGKGGIYFKGWSQIYNYGSLNIESGYYYSDSFTGGRIVRNMFDGATHKEPGKTEETIFTMPTLNISGGVLESNYTVVTNYGLANITGGELISHSDNSYGDWSYAVINRDPYWDSRYSTPGVKFPEIHLKNVTIRGVQGVLGLDDGTANIESGNYLADPDNKLSFYALSAANECIVDVAGGNFVGGGANPYVAWVNTDCVTISGGTFEGTFLDEATKPISIEAVLDKGVSVKTDENGKVIVNKASEETLSTTIEFVDINYSSNLGMRYYVPQSEIDKFDEVVLQCRKETYAGNDFNGYKYVEAEYLGYKTVSNTKYYVYGFNDLRFNEMTSIVTCDLLATKNGETFKTDSYSFSFASHMKRLLEAHKDGTMTLTSTKVEIIKKLFELGTLSQQDSNYHLSDLASNYDVELA